MRTPPCPESTAFVGRLQSGNMHSPSQLLAWNTHLGVGFAEHQLALHSRCPMSNNYTCACGRSLSVTAGRSFSAHRAQSLRRRIPLGAGYTAHQLAFDAHSLSFQSSLCASVRYSRPMSTRRARFWHRCIRLGNGYSAHQLALYSHNPSLSKLNVHPDLFVARPIGTHRAHAVCWGTLALVWCTRRTNLLLMLTLYRSSLLCVRLGPLQSANKHSPSPLLA
jgi:hypothetical protein